MRLSKQLTEIIADVARKAQSGECHIPLYAPNRSMAAAMFRAASEHVEAGGGAPVISALKWRFANGSTIAVEVRSAAEMAQTG